MFTCFYCLLIPHYTVGIGDGPLDPACNACYEHHPPLTKKEDLVPKTNPPAVCEIKCCPHFGCGSEAMDGSEGSGSSSQAAAVQNGDTTNSARDTGSAGKISSAANGLGIWMFFLAGSVLAAMAAINMGQKKKPKVLTNKHPMAGSVNRRVGAVSAFADGALGSSLGGVDAAPGAADTGVELQSGYHIDAQPDGSFEVENGTRVV